MFANLKALLVVLPFVAFAFQAPAQAQNPPRGLWELSPIAPLVGPRPVQTANNTPTTAAVRPNHRDPMPVYTPPIFTTPSSFWPRGADDLLTLAQIRTIRDYIQQRLLEIIPNPRIPIGTIIAVNAHLQYWNQLYTWKLERAYPRTNW